MTRVKHFLKRIVIVIMVVSTMNFTHATESEAVVSNQISDIPILVSGTDEINVLKNYDIEISAIEDEYTVIPIVVTESGQLYININIAQIASTVNFKLYTDEACHYPVTLSSYDFLVNQNEDNRNYSIPIPQAAKYYLKAWYSSSGIMMSGNINITPFLIARSNQQLTLGAWSRIMAPSYNNQEMYHKVIVPASGYLGIEVRLPSTSSLNLTLCRGDKTEIINTFPKTGGIVKYYPVSKGTYYFKTKGDRNVWSEIRCTLVKGQFSLQEKKSVLFSNMVSKMTMDFKFKAEKTGLLITSGYSTGDSNITLLNARKAVLTNVKSFAGSTYHGFAVKKGMTYYFRIQNFSDSGINYIINKIAQGKNKTKKKAKTLKKNKKNAGLFIAGEKTKYWYKFKFSKKKKLKINISSAGSGMYASRVYDKKGKMISITSNNGVVKSIRKLKKGTYYYVIEPKTKTTGGFELTL